MNARTAEAIQSMHRKCDLMGATVSAILMKDGTISPQKRTMLRDARTNLICARNWLLAAERSDPQEMIAGEPVSETGLPQGVNLQARSGERREQAGLNIQEAGHDGNI